MKQGKWLPIAENVVRQTADVIGQHSAAAQALADAESRRAAGEAVEFFRSGGAIIVRGTPKKRYWQRVLIPKLSSVGRMR